MMHPIRALKRRLQCRWRTRRMRAFLTHMRPLPDARVLDLGGTEDMWRMIAAPLRVTLLNTEAAWTRQTRSPPQAHVVGDACDLSRWQDGAFDIVFSNSVIEHVGDDQRVARFAAEARRVGAGYWIQTPCYLFPIEAHTGWPWFWFYPRAVRALLVRWFDRPSARDSRPDPVGETRWFTLRRLRALFPDGQVYTERVAGLPKSWSLYRPPPAGSRRLGPAPAADTHSAAAQEVDRARS